MLRLVIRAAFCGLVLAGLPAYADDWPMYGRDQTHNAVSPETNPPTDWDVGEFDRKSGVWNREKSRNLKWQTALGSTIFGDPVVAGGLIWIGTNNYQPGKDDAPDASVLACLRESDGQLLYRFVSPRLPAGRSQDWPFSGMNCSPLVEGERIWFTTNRCETICLDIAPLLRGAGEPREVWRLDMARQLKVVPRSPSMGLAHLCSIAGYRDLIYVITGNGVDDSYKVASPEAPSLIYLKKESGEIVWQDNSPGANIAYGQWSSPLVIDQGNHAQVVVPQGDGWLRSFDALTGKLTWKFDINFKSSRLVNGGNGTRNDISATPVLYDGRLYVASGQQAEHGEGSGRLVCIDPTRTGDISSELAVDADGRALAEDRVQTVDPAKGQRAIANPNSGLVWEYVESDRNGDGKLDFAEQFHRTLGNCTIKDNLLFVADQSGLVHCLDAPMGRVHWTHDMLASAFGSPLIVGDKVYVADEDGDVAIYGLSADPQKAMRKGPEGPAPLGEFNLGNSIYCSPIFANGTLLVATRDRLFAIAQSAGTQGNQAGYWPQWRGPDRDNVSTEKDLLQEWPEGGPPLEWRTDGIGTGIASVAVAGGFIYTLGSSGDHEHVIALHEATGELHWRSPIGPAINDAPLMRWLSQRTPTLDGERLYVSTSRGDLVCLQTADGKEVWRKNYAQDFASRGRSWGFVDYPLVDGERLICMPGGPDATLVALDKTTGGVLWKCLVDPKETGSYAAPILVEAAGERQVVAFLSRGVAGVRAADGKLLWRHEVGARIANTHTPIFADGHILACPGYANAIDVLALARDGDSSSARVARSISVRADPFQDSSLRRGDHLFVTLGNSAVSCLNWKTGAEAWRARTTGKGKIAQVYADERLYLLHSDGTLILAEASPDGYRERGKFVIPDHQPSIGATFPVVMGGRMLVRDNDHLLCYVVRRNVDGLAASPRLVKLEPAAASAAPGAAARAPAKNKEPDAIFVPTPHDVVAKMLEVAEVRKTDVVYDLGSGDGRIVMAAARSFGAKAVGIELDEELVRQSRASVNKAGLDELVRIEHADIFTQDLSGADVIALYLPPKLMDRLLPQLARLKPGARVVSHFFKFTDIPPHKSLRMDSRDDGDAHEIYLWTAPLVKPAP